MRYDLRIILFVACCTAVLTAVKGDFVPRVLFFDDPDDLVETRADAIMRCSAKGYCIAHLEQLQKDLNDGYTGHHSCGFIWSHDGIPVHAHCINTIIGENGAEICVKSEIRSGSCGQVKYGIYCRQQREGERIMNPCPVTQSDLIEMFRLDGPFYSVGEASKACQDEGTELAYYDHVAAWVTYYDIGWCQYNFLREMYQVYQINCKHSHTIDWAFKNPDGNGYGAICRGEKPHDFRNPCKDPNPIIVGRQVHCVNGAIVIQDRPECEKETFSFDIKGRTKDDWEFGFGAFGLGFWFGNDGIYRLSNANKCKLILELGVKEEGGVVLKKAVYNTFRLENTNDVPCNRYKLIAQDYDEAASDAGDALNEGHYGGLTDAGQYFSDGELDCDWVSGRSCSDDYKSAWWFSSCTKSNINGLCYDESGYDEKQGKSRLWWTVNGATEANGHEFQPGLYSTRMMLKCWDD